MVIGIRRARDGIDEWKIIALKSPVRSGTVSTPIGLGVIPSPRRVPWYATKEKRFVLFDRPTEGAAEDVSSVGRLLAVGQVVGGVQNIVAHEFEDVAVEIIRSGFRNLIDDTARGAPIFRVVVVRQDLEFFHGVRIGADDDIVAEKISIVRSIQKKRERFRALPAH